MNILNENTDKNSFSKPEMELVEKEKQEYKLIGKFMRTKGLRLFSYNSKGELKELAINKKKEAILTFNHEGKLAADNLTHEEVMVDARDIHFEALNLKSAQKRLNNYKQGKIKELCNLRVPSTNSLKLF